MRPAGVVGTLRYIGLVTALIATVWSCASTNSQGPPGVLRAKLKKGSIEVWVDRANRCRTNTSRYFQVKKSEKAVWDIKTVADCDFEVEIRFDKGDGDPLATTCARKNKTKIECDIHNDANVKRYEYSVIINGIVEDPEIEIVM